MDTITTSVPRLRITACNQAPIQGESDYVLYWMIAARRTKWSYGLDRAADWARALGKPLLVLEPLRSGYPWASDRIHRFVIQGMVDNARLFQRTRTAYYPYVELEHGEGQGLLECLSQRAAVVVTDDFPCFFLPQMVRAATEKLSVRVEKIDSNGLLPMRATDRVFLRAVDFRRFTQKTLGQHLDEMPLADPLKDGDLPRLEQLPTDIVRRWPVADIEKLTASSAALADLAIDHSVSPVFYQGGSVAAGGALRRFIDDRFARYISGRRSVEDRATSQLSPYLHFGHISSHEIFAAILEQEAWNPSRLFHKATGSRLGWWGMSEEAETFLDQIVTWRELGFNMCRLREDYARYESLPVWAQETLEAHRADPRPYVYSLEQFEQAATHDDLWNAAQRELVQHGFIHNYLRMLWGKKILEWSESPREALAVMIELNNKYATDGRDPNSYSGIFWTLGRYDRAWGPERPIFGKIRFMSSDSTRRKLDAKSYIAGQRNLDLR